MCGAGRCGVRGEPRPYDVDYDTACAYAKAVPGPSRISSTHERARPSRARRGRRGAFDRHAPTRHDRRWFHVHPASMASRCAARKARVRFSWSPTPCRRSAPTDEFLPERTGNPAPGRALTLADGTLAGADIDMLSSVRFVHQRLVCRSTRRFAWPPPIRRRHGDRLAQGPLLPGTDADFVCLTPESQ